MEGDFPVRPVSPWFNRVVGDGMGTKGVYVKQGDLFGVRTVFVRAGRAGVRASVVARKRGNARGAKGRRKVEA